MQGTSAVSFSEADCKEVQIHQRSISPFGMGSSLRTGTHGDALRSIATMFPGTQCSLTAASRLILTSQRKSSGASRSKRLVPIYQRMEPIAAASARCAASLGSHMIMRNNKGEVVANQNVMVTKEGDGVLEK